MKDVCVQCNLYTMDTMGTTISCPTYGDVGGFDAISTVLYQCKGFKRGRAVLSI